MTSRSLSPKQTQNMPSEHLLSFVCISAVEAVSFHDLSITAFAKGFRSVSASYLDLVTSEAPGVH